MSKLGDDVLEWQTDQLVEWLQQEGLDDCIGPFNVKRIINGRTLVNLSEFEIKSLHHVSHESKKKLIKAVEKFKRKKKAHIENMFGKGNQVQTVHTRKPPSFCQEDEAGSDEDGWGSEEWDSSGSQDASSESDGDGEYLEPEEDLSKGGLQGRETAAVPSGLVAQLRAGIASSLSRRPVVGVNKPPAPVSSYEDDDEIYDEPPNEEELYDEPSDSSGGAVVVRPPPKKPPPKKPPPKKPPKREEREDKGDYLHLREMDEEQDMYETPLEEDDFLQKSPSRPNKTNKFIPTRVAHGNKFVPPVVNNNNENETYDIPEIEEEEQEDSYEIPEEQAVPPPRPPKGASAPAKQPKPAPSQKFTPGRIPPKGPQPSGKLSGVLGRFQGSNTRSQSSLSPQGTPFQPPLPIQTKMSPSSRGGRPAPEPKKKEFPPPKPAPTHIVNPGGQGSSWERGPPEIPAKPAAGNVAPGVGPKAAPRAGILNRKDPPPRTGVPPLPPASHRKQAPLPTERLPLPEPSAPPMPSVPPPTKPPPPKVEAVPPRPPKKGQPVGNQQPVLPPRHSDERQGVPLPPPPVSSSSNASFLKEQSSASSIESTSADEPITSLQHQPNKPKRSLPALPPSEPKSSLEMMKDAPWFQGPVDRKEVETSLKKLHQNGSFLVRNSTRSPNDYSMSLFYNGNVRHLRIPHKNNKYVLGDSGVQAFETIIDLVNHYRNNEVDLKTGGKTKLTVPCQVYKS